MEELIKYGWTIRQYDTVYKLRFLRISVLMRVFKSREIENFEYVLIDQYFIDNNNLYFIGNNEVYSIDLNDDFNYYDLELDYKKVKFICKYSIEKIIELELISPKYKRDKRINEVLNLSNKI